MKLITACSPINFASAYQPGGVMTVVTGNWVGRLSECAPDSHGLGQWTTSTLRGKMDTHLTIVTAYQVCKDNIQTTGAKTAFRQQWSLLRHSHAEPDPRKSFISDLDALLTQLGEASHEIILLLDANESLSDRYSGIRTLTRKHNLADLHTRLHGLEGQPATYIRGTKKIDFIFGSKGVAGNTSRAGITPFETSDHRGLFVDVRLPPILGGPATPLSAAQHRDLNSKDPKSPALYRNTCIDYFENRRVLEERTAEMHTKLLSDSAYTGKDSALLASIDNDTSRGLAASAKACASKHRHLYSPILRKLQVTVRYWKYWLKEFRTKKWFGSQRNYIQNKIDLQSIPTICPPVAILQTNIRKAQNELKKAI